MGSRVQPATRPDVEDERPLSSIDPTKIDSVYYSNSPKQQKSSKNAWGGNSGYPHSHETSTDHLEAYKPVFKPDNVVAHSPNFSKRSVSKPTRDVLSSPLNSGNQGTEEPTELDGKLALGREQLNFRIKRIRSRARTVRNIGGQKDKQRVLLGFDNTRAFYIIGPQAPFMRRWDVLIPLLLLFTATCTPFEVGFIEPSTKADSLFWVNRLVDLCFMADLIINFFLGYKLVGEGIVVYNQMMIARRYLNGWFAIDVVSVLPFDTVNIIVGGGMSSNSSFQIVSRSLRLLRLLKLLRLLRMARIFERLKTSVGLSYLQISMIKYTLVVLMTVHWIACVWGIVGSMTIDSGPGESWILDNDFANEGQLSRYFASVEFSLFSLAIGYGSVKPSNTTERIFAVCCMITGGAVYACVIAGICEALTNSNPGELLFTKTMDTLNMYLDHINLPDTHRPMFREYLANSYDRLQDRLYSDMIDFISPDLQGALAFHCHSRWICKVPFFLCDDDTENGRFVVAVARALKNASYISNEELCAKGDVATNMFILRRGIVAFGGKVRTQGRFFGEDMILRHGRRLHTMRALTFVDAMTLLREDLFNLLEQQHFAKTSHIIRTATLRLALLRWFQHIGNILVNVQHAFRKPMTKDEVATLKQKLQRKARQTKRSVKQNGRQLDVQSLQEKIAHLNQLLPAGTTLFPPAPKPTSQELSKASAKTTLEIATKVDEHGKLLHSLQSSVMAMETSVSAIAKALDIKIPATSKGKKLGRLTTKY